MERGSHWLSDDEYLYKYIYIEYLDLSGTNWDSHIKNLPEFWEIAPSDGVLILNKRAGTVCSLMSLELGLPKFEFIWVDEFIPS